MSVLQWNIHSYIHNLTFLTHLITNISPDVICLQETKLPSDGYEINGYKPYHKIYKEDKIASGGTSIFVKKNLLQTPIKIISTLQVKAVKVTINKKPITICSIYIPPKQQFNVHQLIEIENQLPTPYIITGDFNAHSPLWGQQDLNAKGKIIEDFINQTNICLLNDQSSTYVSPSTFNTSSVDLTFCHPSIFTNLKWSTLDDLHHSDHYPITINYNLPQNSEIPEYYKFKKANWSSFSSECKEKLNTNIEKTFDNFYQTLDQIIKKNVPKLRPKPRKNKCWFNSECNKATREKKPL